MPVDVRCIVAALRDLDLEAREGRLRLELLHRLQGITVAIPPLRERREDVPELVDLLLRGGEQPRPRCEAGVLERLAAHAWPGNVRELRNLLARLRLEHPRGIPPRAVTAALATGRPASLFPRDALGRGTLAELTHQLERDYLVFQLERHDGDTRAVSRLLGITRKHLYRRCQKVGIRLR